MTQSIPQGLSLNGVTAFRFNRIRSLMNVSGYLIRGLPPRCHLEKGLSCCLAGWLVLSASISQAQLADSSWADYGGGYKNQHRSPYQGPTVSPALLWEFDLESLGTSVFDRGHHQPILLPDGTIVLNTADTSDDRIVAINPDGTLRWQVDDSSLGPWLAADDGNQIYTIRGVRSGTTTSLRSVDFDGNSLWSQQLPGSPPRQNGPAIGLDGNIYASSDFASLTAMNSAGATDWTSVESGYYVNPAIASDGTIIVGGNNLSAVAPDGSVLWQHPVTTTIGKFPSYLSPAIADDGTIFAGQINYPNLVALNPNGTELWSRTDLDGAPAIGPDGTIYVVPETGILHALNPLDGSTLWSYATGKTDYYNSEGVTIDSNGNLFVSNEDGFVISLSPDGNVLWSIDLAPDRDGFIGLGAPVIGSNGELYVVGGLTGKVFALVPEPGSLVLAIISISVLAISVFVRRSATISSALRFSTRTI